MAKNQKNQSTEDQESLDGKPILMFKDQKEWAKWLAKNQAASPGIWLRIAKKASEMTSISYEEAVEAGLCQGWIDGLKKTYDEHSWLQKFTPRGAKSVWSKINRGKAERLIAEGRMKPAGMATIELAKNDGRWEAAYDSSRTSTVPDDLQEGLDKNPKAKAFFAKLNNTNRYAILFRIQTARKAETRARRIEQFIAMLERHEKLHP